MFIYEIKCMFYLIFIFSFKKIKLRMYVFFVLKFKYDLESNLYYFISRLRFKFLYSFDCEIL